MPQSQWLLVMEWLAALSAAGSKALQGQLVLADLQNLAAKTGATGFVTQNGVIFECIQLDALNVEMGGAATGWQPQP